MFPFQHYENLRIQAVPLSTHSPVREHKDRCGMIKTKPSAVAAIVIVWKDRNAEVHEKTADLPWLLIIIQVSFLEINGLNSQSVMVPVWTSCPRAFIIASPLALKQLAAAGQCVCLGGWLLLGINNNSYIVAVS